MRTLTPHHTQRGRVGEAGVPRSQQGPGAMGVCPLPPEGPPPAEGPALLSLLFGALLPSLSASRALTAGTVSPMSLRPPSALHTLGTDTRRRGER